MNIDTSQTLQTIRGLAESLLAQLPHIAVGFVVFVLFFFAGKDDPAVRQRLREAVREVTECARTEEQRAVLRKEAARLGEEAGHVL